MNLLVTLVDRWWDNRFDPLAHVGFNRMVRGWRRGQNPEMAVGLGMLLVGMSRRRPRRRIFVTEVAAGQDIGIRVVARGEVVNELDIPGPNR